MTEITLEAIEAKHAETAKMIEQYKNQPKASTICLAAALLHLLPGERYAGSVLKADGSVDYHLAKLPAEAPDDLTHCAAMEWAESVGGKLPNRREIRLLQSNLGDTLPTSGWAWLEEVHETNASSAWGCHFGYGSLYCHDRSAEGGAVAVRRLNP
jgi:hypothetical protein